MEYPQLITQTLQNSLVFDFGSYTTKIGDSDSPEPLNIFPSAVTTTGLIGDALTRNTAPEIQYFMKNGELTDSDLLEVFLTQYQKQQNFQQPTLITTPFFTPKQQKFAQAQLFFEKFDSRALYFYDSEAASAAAGGLTNAINIDLGYGKSSISCILDGKTLHNSSILMNLNGELIMNNLDLKSEKLNLIQSMQIKTDILAVVARIGEEAGQCQIQNEFPLPDGTIIQTGILSELEGFFSPSTQKLTLGNNSLQFNVFSVLQALPDFSQKELLMNIIPTGGLSNIQNINSRIRTEVEQVCGLAGKVRINQLNNGITRKDCASWLGGSILGSLSIFGYLWVSRGEWDEFGDSIFERRGMV
ncbi:actin [Spironucleus salmonicida]|uniref:Actin n=1 Tax=Spironucleus salmonicida TaxID=348837 RepID=V6LDH3_9EUKA|nr:actin [Spironucleus salmonicida]|eukprot:EST42560.1 Actin [Spironucleus salmonicida]